MFSLKFHLKEQKNFLSPKERKIFFLILEKEIFSSFEILKH